VVRHMRIQHDGTVIKAEAPDLLPMRNVLWVLLVVAVMILAAGCAEGPSGSRYIKDGKEYGTVRGTFRDRWWNYYERGLSFAEGAFYSEAIDDLRRAASQRNEDQRTARTYGMHFTDYFPHREMGIAHYLQGDLEAARKELALSLTQFPSAKAKFYLDQVRKGILRQSGVEKGAPVIRLALKEEEIWTREDFVVVKGTAQDEHFVSSVRIGGVPLYLDGSDKKISFTKNLPLPQGRHLVEIEAANLLGGKANHTVIFHVDRVGPMIALKPMEFEDNVPERQVRLSGTLYDETGVSGMTVNGRPYGVVEGTETPFDLRLKAEEGRVELVAVDRLGNRTSAWINLTRSTGLSGPVLVAGLNEKGLFAGFLGPKDTQPPMIRLSGWSDRQTVYMDRIYLEGEISDDSEIVALKINDASILRGKGQRIFFSHVAELAEGENVLRIVAEDRHGNTARKDLIVIREIPRAVQLAERMRLTVMPFEEKGSLSDVSLSYQDNLLNALVKQNRFRVVEREKLDMILAEQKLSRTQLIEKNTALSLGKLVATQAIITGSIIESRTGIEMVGRVVDTETSEILDTEDVYTEERDLMALKRTAEGMAIKFHRDFPLVSGLVIDQKDRFVFTDLGKDKILMNRRLIVYREEPVKHPVTGKLMGMDNVILGHARVNQLMPEMSKAEVVVGDTGLIRPLDKVISE
jgi:TolB-like protein